MNLLFILFLIHIIVYLLIVYGEDMLKKKRWDSNIRIIEWVKQLFAFSWISYFLLEIDFINQIAKQIYNFLALTFLGVVGHSIYKYRLEILLIFTGLYVVIKVLHYLLVWHRILKYKNLKCEMYPAYNLMNYPFQEKLCEFLNKKPKFGNNIYWLDGGWGSGKTHFIRTFFEQQEKKLDEIYYISCFGIKTREQVERILVTEIENHSTFGQLDFIPGLGSIFKWLYKVMGLDLIKKNSIIIFDDLERVSYPEEVNKEDKDKPEDYNDILGFIDYLANHKNQKIIVIFNESEIVATYQKIIEPKFKPSIQKFPKNEEIVKSIIDKNYEGKHKNLLIKLFTLSLDNTVTPNFRDLTRFLQEIRNSSDISDILTKFFNENKTNFSKSLSELANKSKLALLLLGNHRLQYLLLLLKLCEHPTLNDNKY